MIKVDENTCDYTPYSCELCESYNERR